RTSSTANTHRAMRTGTGRAADGMAPAYITSPCTLSPKLPHARSRPEIPNSTMTSRPPQGEKKAEPRRGRPLPRPVRIIRGRSRLFLVGVIGLVVVAALPAEWKLTTRFLIGWDVGVVLYLAAAFSVVASADVARIRRQSEMQDEGRLMMLVLIVIAAASSMAAIVVELGAAPGAAREPLRLVLATITIALSWAFIHTIFALHYAHEFHA